jgi:hypothetical protein
MTAVLRPRNGVSVRPRARLPAERERSRFDGVARGAHGRDKQVTPDGVEYHRILASSPEARQPGRTLRAYAFSFHPGLRRKADYDALLAPMQQFFQEVLAPHRTRARAAPRALPLGHLPGARGSALLSPSLGPRHPCLGLETPQTAPGSLHGLKRVPYPSSARRTLAI